MVIVATAGIDEGCALTGDRGMRVVARPSMTKPEMCAAGAQPRIVNARGVPGTLGSLVRSASDDRPLLLTNYHLLFAAGAGAQDTVWLHARDGGWDGSRLTRIGRTLYGRFRTVEHDGAHYHVDCAVASIDSPSTNLSELTLDVSGSATLGWAHTGETVTKAGGATGLTSGIVIDVDYCEPVYLDGRKHDAPRQLLIRSLGRGQHFSAPGDSGSLIRNARGEPVALLTGITASGHAVACHIVPVFRVLHLRH